MVVRSPTPFELDRNGCWPSPESQLPRALPSHKPFFSLAQTISPSAVVQGAAHNFFKVVRLSFLFCLSLALLGLFILLLMSGNVYPNPGPVFPYSVCAGNVIWRGRSVQCSTCSKWVPLRCSLLSFSQLAYLHGSIC